MIGWWEEIPDLGTDEVLDLGTDEALEASTSAFDTAMEAADGAFSAIGDAISTGTREALSAAEGIGTRVLGTISTMLRDHSDLLIALINAGVASYTVYQKIQSEIATARQKKNELADQLTALREQFAGRPPTGGAPAGGGTTITVGTPALPAAAAAAPNYAAYGFIGLLGVIVAWMAAKRFA